MNVRKPISKRFQQLRWRLTLSYTGVTVGVLLVIGLISIIVVTSVLINSVKQGLYSDQFIEAGSNQYAPALRPFLAQSPPDQPGIADWLNRFSTTPTPIMIANGVPIIINEGELELLVVGIDGQLLGITESDLLAFDRIGDVLDEQVIPGLSEPLRAAIAGETDPERLYTFTESDNLMISAVPIWDAGNEQVLGALVMFAKIPTVTAMIGDSIQTFVTVLVEVVIIAGLIGTLFGSLAARGLVRRLNQLTEASLTWSQGDFSVLVNDSSGDELGQLGRRLNQMAEQLQNLFDTRRELAVIEERNRLARDLHDSVKQQAFAAAAQLDAVQTLIEHDPAAASDHVRQAVLLVDELRQELTGLIQELRPAALQGKGLMSALRDYAASWSAQSEIISDVHVQGERLLSLEVEQALFRIIQEALANVARHSHAHRVEILLVYSMSVVTLTIDDDGQGFSIDGGTNGLGLQSMQQRAESLGGKLTIESRLGQGTRLTCTVPAS